MKHLPNILSGLRILFALCLLFVPTVGVRFYVLYVLCGISDVMDGWFARRFHVESILGSRLDSAADFVMVCVLLWRLVPVIQPNKVVLQWIAAIALLRFAAALTAKLRFGHWGFLHTSGNKLTGGLLFLYPLVLGFNSSIAVLYLLCMIATFSAAEELLIELTAKTWDVNRRSMLISNKEGLS